MGSDHLVSFSSLPQDAQELMLTELFGRPKRIEDARPSMKFTQVCRSWRHFAWRDARQHRFVGSAFGVSGGHPGLPHCRLDSLRLLCPLIEEVCLSKRQGVTDQDLQAFGSMPHLKRLKMCDMPHITDEGMRLLCSGVSRIRWLSISCMRQLANKSLAVIAEGSTRSSLRHFSICKVSRVASAGLCKTLALVDLKKLAVAGCFGIAKPFRYFKTHYVGGNISLKRLAYKQGANGLYIHKQFNNSEDDLFAAGICKIEGLETLELNDFKGLSAPSLRALQTLTNLKVLSVGLSFDFSAQAAEILNSFQSLEELRMWGVHLRQRGYGIDAFVTGIGARLRVLAIYNADCLKRIALECKQLEVISLGRPGFKEFLRLRRRFPTLFTCRCEIHSLPFSS